MGSANLGDELSRREDALLLSKILIIDDEEANVRLLKRILTSYGRLFETHLKESPPMQIEVRTLTENGIQPQEFVCPRRLALTTYPDTVNPSSHPKGTITVAEEYECTG